MTSTTKSPPRKVFRLFRFQDISWVEVLTGQLEIDSANSILKISYRKQNLVKQLPLVLKNQSQSMGKQSHERFVCISWSKLTMLEQDKNDKKIVYFWLGSEPLSMSFLSEEVASSVVFIMEELQQGNSVDDVNEKSSSDELTFEFLKYCIEESPCTLSMLIINSQTDVMDIIFKYVEECVGKGVTQEQKQSCFLVIKTAIKLGNADLMQKMIQNQNFFLLLQVLSWNPFNNNFQYHQEYTKNTFFNNCLKINDQQMLKVYEQNARLKFIRDVATCMFIEIEAERVIQNLINNRNKMILSLFKSSNNLIKSIINLAHVDPINYINVFVETLTLFKATTFDYESQSIKNQFMNIIKSQQVHIHVIKCVNSILQTQQYQKQVDIRFHEKWIEALNPYLSNSWEWSQDWMISSSKQNSLLNVLQRLMQNCHDEGLIESILNFVRWLIEPSENRIIMQSGFTNYVYNQFVSHIWDTACKSTFLIELFLNFIIKIYKVDYVRTRRVLIQNQVILKLEKQIKKKPILICIIKLVESFLEVDNQDVFVYLRNHLCFRNLKEEYFRNKSSFNIVSSCFKSLFRKFEIVDSSEGRKFFDELFGVSIK